jgi:hypothetical protein
MVMRDEALNGRAPIENPLTEVKTLRRVFIRDETWNAWNVASLRHIIHLSLDLPSISGLENMLQDCPLLESLRLRGEILQHGHIDQSSTPTLKLESLHTLELFIRRSPIGFLSWFHAPILQRLRIMDCFSQIPQYPYALKLICPSGDGPSNLTTLTLHVAFIRANEAIELLRHTPYLEILTALLDSPGSNGLVDGLDSPSILPNLKVLTIIQFVIFDAEDAMKLVSLATTRALYTCGLDELTVDGDTSINTEKYRLQTAKQVKTLHWNLFEHHY